MRALLRAMFVDPRWSEDAACVARRVDVSLRPGAWGAVAASRFKNPIVAARGQFGRPDETPYGNISVPVLVIAGKGDKLRLPGYADELAKRFKNAELHVIEGCGHCPHIERPDHQPYSPKVSRANGWAKPANSRRAGVRLGSRSGWPGPPCGAIRIAPERPDARIERIVGY
jgi:pimeloyl-ACP methyl ester carboxylesterase